VPRNPFSTRATLAAHPGEYKWSSYHANAQGSHDPIIESHPLHVALGYTVEKPQQAYRELFRHHIDDDFKQSGR
jgi:putative transposase